MAEDENVLVTISGTLGTICPLNFELSQTYKIHKLIIANDLQGIRSRLDGLTLRKRHSIAAAKALNKTLLRYACELGFRDIVKYLLDECGLDISERYTHRLIWLSPLLISIYNLDVSMVLLLISRGAVVVDKTEMKTGSYNDLNIGNFSMQSIFNCSQYGTSELLPVLPFIKNMTSYEDLDYILRATTLGKIEEMEILRAYRINVAEKFAPYDNALFIAILNKRSDVENFLLTYGIFTLKDHVRALELCGATFIACNSDIEQGLLCWKKSIRIRKEQFFGISDKFSNKTKTVLGVEFTCEKELDMMANSKVDLNIQALIVLVRLLPLNDEFLQHTFLHVSRKHVFRNNLLQALKVLEVFSEFLNYTNSGDDGSSGRCAWSFATLLRIPFSECPSNVDELLLRLKNLFDAFNGFDWSVLLAGRINFYLWLYDDLIISLLYTLVGMQDFDLFENDEAWIKDGVTSIMRCPSGVYPTTLLHKAIQEDDEIIPVITFIVSCTTDANVMDKYKRTPMHLAFDIEHAQSYILRLVTLLADAGGHIDSMNLDNRTPYMMFKENGVIKNPLKFLSLQCLAAQTIHKHNIEIPEIYPKILVSFIKLHSNDTVSTSVDEYDHVGSGVMVI